MKISFTLLFSCFLCYFTTHGQGDTLSNSFVHDDSLRTYLLYIPAAYDGSEEWPLIINLHGFATNPSFQMTFSNMNAVADTAHFIVAYPQGLTMVATIPGFPPPSPGFNLGADSLFFSPDDVDDVGFISQLIDTVMTDYNIAADRIYATGHSNGGMFSHVLACELEDRIAAIAAVGATLPTTWPCLANRAVPVLQINGTADMAVNYEMGLPGLLNSVPETIEFWTMRNGCDASPTITTLPDISTADSSTVEYHQWENCEAEVAHFKVFGGGHQWPGGNNLLPFLGHFNLDINASAEIWNFFNRNPHPNPVGRVISENIIHDDSLRTYLLYIPAAYDGSEEWPLIINLHGFATNPSFQMTFSNMNAVADTAHFIVAYPEGLTIVATIPGFPPPSPGFNLGADSLFFSPDDVDDVGFISQLIDTVMTDYNIAADRIYATGHSNGGMFSHVLACELEDRIAAIAAVGATLPTTWPCLANRAVPVLQINGTADMAVNYEMGLPGLLNSVPGTIEFWTTQNGCDASPTVMSLPDINTEDNSTVEYHQWENCEAEVAHFKVFDGGHQWPGGNNLLPFLGNFNLDINASAEIWNFFNRNPHPNVTTSTTAFVKSILDQVKIYPNPSYGEMTIEFDLMQAGTIQLRLFSVLGQPIGKTVKQHFPSGQQKFIWNPHSDNLPPGPYFIQIRAGEEFWTQSVLIQSN